MIPINDRWALGADSSQWILLKRRAGSPPWRGVSFVSSTKDVLARCMRAKGVPGTDAQKLLRTLPETFKEWAQEGRSRLAIADLAPPLASGTPSAAKAPMPAPSGAAFEERP